MQKRPSVIEDVEKSYWKKQGRFSPRKLRKKIEQVKRVAQKEAVKRVGQRPRLPTSMYMKLENKADMSPDRERLPIMM
jgi:hypothetical protein